VNFKTFTFICEGLRVLSAAFMWILLLATTCHTSALNNWHVAACIHCVTYLYPTTLGQPACFLIISQ